MGTSKGGWGREREEGRWKGDARGNGLVCGTLA